MPFILFSIGFEVVSLFQDDGFECSRLKGFIGTSIDALQTKEAFPTKNRSVVQYADVICRTFLFTLAAAIAVLIYPDFLPKELCSRFFHFPCPGEYAAHELRPGSVYNPCQKVVSDTLSL